MKPTLLKYFFSVKTIPVMAGLIWALFAASRFALPVVTGTATDPGLIWVWLGLWQPILAGLAAWLVQGLIWAGQILWLQNKGLKPQRAGETAARSWWPCLALVLVMILQFLGTPLKLGLAVSAIIWECWPLAGLAVLLAVLLQTKAAVPVWGEPPATENRRWLAPAVFAAALFVFAVMGWRLSVFSQRVGPFMGGDEPQYLFNAHTLAVDRDLDLLNNILLRENYLFLSPDRVIGGHGGFNAQGKWLSKHRPGLPLLMTPFYAWGMYTGLGVRKACTILVWLLGAWMVLEVFLLARDVTTRDGPALFAAGMAGLALPGLIYSNLLFPEMAAATFSVAAFRRIRRAQAGQWRLLLWAGLFTAYLGWFHERFILISLLLGAYMLFKGHFKSPRGLAAFLVPCLISAGILMHYFQIMYGHPFPTVSVHARGSYLNPRGVWEGLSGIWVDAAEGILPYGALWLAAVAGVVWLIRRRPGDGVWVALMALATYLLAGLYVDWFGGINPPSRYLVAAVPFLAVGLSAGAAWAPPRFFLIAAVLALPTLAAEMLVLRYPSAIYGHNVLLDASFEFPLVLNLLPTYILSKGNPAEVNAYLGLIWVILAAIVVVALQFGSRSFAPRRALAGLIAGVLLVTAAAVAAERVGPGLLGQAEFKHGELNMDIVPAKYHHLPSRPLASPAGAVEIARGVVPTLFVWGQYLTLPSGRYRVTADISTFYHGPETVAWMDVTRDMGRVELAERKVEGPEATRPVSLDFVLPVGGKKVELRIGTTGRAALKLRALTLTRLAGGGRAE